MAGLVSSLGVILRYAKNIEKEGVAEGTLTTLKDKELQLMKADGSMVKLLSKYVVEPVAVVSDDLRDVEELDSILGLHMDMFTGYYMQVFELLRDVYGLDSKVVVDLLSTDAGGINMLIGAGAKRVLTTSKEDLAIKDYLGDMLRDAELSTEARASIRSRQSRTNSKLETAERLSALRDSESRTRERDSKTRERNNNIKNTPLREVGRSKVDLSGRSKDLIVPNAIQRSIEVSVNLKAVDESGNPVIKTIIIPITIKLAIMFTSKENIVEAISTKDSSYGFSERLDDYRSGAISLADFLFASDLITKYKSKKLKGRDDLEKLLSSRELSANSKALTSGAVGFEKNYNMYIISPEAKTSIEHSVKSKLSKSKGRDKFLEQGNGFSVTVVDPDYERIQIMLRETRGTTDISFRNAVKKDKNGSDFSEIIKALVANKPPAF